MPDEAAHAAGGERHRRTASCSVDTLIIIPNQNLFRVANEKTTFADAFAMADQVLYSGVACITDLMVKEGLINLDFADVRSIMSEMGKAMMGTGEATGERRAVQAAEAAIANPLLDEVSMKGARGLLISITGGNDLTLYEVNELPDVVIRGDELVNDGDAVFEADEGALGDDVAVEGGVMLDGGGGSLIGFEIPFKVCGMGSGGGFCSAAQRAANFSRSRARRSF